MKYTTLYSLALAILPMHATAQSDAEHKPASSIVVVEDITVDNRGFWTGNVNKDFPEVAWPSGSDESLQKGFPGRWKWIAKRGFLDSDTPAALLVRGRISDKTEDGFVVTEMRLVKRVLGKWKEVARLNAREGLVGSGMGPKTPPPAGTSGFDLVLRVMRDRGAGPGSPVWIGLMVSTVGRSGIPNDDPYEIYWSPTGKKFVSDQWPNGDPGKKD